mgnify:CR=1 FL=1
MSGSGRSTTRPTPSCIAPLLWQGLSGGGGGGKGKGGGGIPNPVKLTVTGYTDGGMIPDNLKCADSPSPAISWTGAPAAAKSFAIIMHDTDVSFGGSDVLHWAIFDIPGTATSLPAGVEKKAEVAGGAKQLNNIGGTAGRKRHDHAHGFFGINREDGRCNRPSGDKGDYQT